MSMLIAAAFILASPMPATPPALPDWGKDPTVNLSAIRYISCDSKDPLKRGWTGSGAMVADGILMTAKHVADGKNCKDIKTGKRASMYVVEDDTDFALMHLDIKGVPMIKYSCDRFVSGMTYQSYGYSGYLQNAPIFRQSNLKAYPGYSGPDFEIRGLGRLPHMRRMYGPMVFGMSGGPVIDTMTGVARGINNAGYTVFGLMTGHSYSTELADTILCKR